MKTRLLIPALLLAGAALAHDYRLGALSIGHPYASTTVAGQRTGGGYMKLDNGGAADRLLAARTPVCEHVEMHTMKLEGDIMRMRQLDTIELPARQSVELKPGALHLMLVGLKAPLKAGDKFPLTLKFEKAGELTVEVVVEAPRGAQQHQH